MGAMARPRIGIPIPTSFDNAYNERSWPEYAHAVTEAGAEAIGIPLDLSDRDLAAVAADCDAYLLPGSGADVNPHRFGQEPIPECAPADAKRERVDWYLLRKAEEERKPLLCICFGTQSLNVYRGGTLVQHLLPMPVNHSAGRAVGKAHSVLVPTDSTLASILDQEEVVADQEGFVRVSVNSSHHQAIGIAGEGLRVVARSAEDAVVEAVEGDSSGPFLLALQWHPERTLDISPSSRLIFARFIAETEKALARDSHR